MVQILRRVFAYLILPQLFNVMIISLLNLDFLRRFVNNGNRWVLRLLD